MTKSPNHYINKTNEAFAFVNRRTQEQLASRAISNTANPSSAANPRSRFAHTAEVLQSELPFNDERQKHLGVISAMPDFVNSLPDLNSKGSKHSTAARLSAVRFNNSLRKIIDYNPEILPTEIVKLVKATAVRFAYNPDVINTVGRQTTVSLRGMQHELAVEAALCYLPDGYEMLETTDNDDLRGKDFRVKTPNGKIISLDIKASEAAARETNMKHDAYFKSTNRRRPAEDIVVQSGFNEGDFLANNPWRPTQESVEKAAIYLQHHIDRAAGHTGATTDLTLARS